MTSALLCRPQGRRENEDERGEILKKGFNS